MHKHRAVSVCVRHNNTVFSMEFVACCAYAAVSETMKSMNFVSSCFTIGGGGTRGHIMIEQKNSWIAP